VQSNVFITIKGERVARIGSTPPEDTPVVELPAELTVLPGLMDCHAHILGDLKDGSPAAALRVSSAQGALWGVHNLQTWLNHGFTTLRDAGESDLGYGQIALRESINRGLITGPRLVCAGGFVTVNGGNGDADVLAPDQSLPRRPNISDTVDDVMRAVRRDLKYGADWIKLIASGGVADPFTDFNTQDLSDEQIKAAVEMAHRAGKRVVAHAEGTVAIKAAVRAGADSIEHGIILDEEGAALMEARGTWLVPTLFAFQHGAELGTSTGADPIIAQKGRDILKYQQPAFELALKHHVKIAYGVDDDPDFVSKEFLSLVKGGMQPLVAIQAATINSAEMLGLSKDIGTLEPGKFADLIAVRGDPLADIGAMERVKVVIKGGSIFKNETRLP
jgi:imidazolonepropionase-like amidohydrolase